MDKLPFDTTGLKDNEIQLFLDTYNNLRKRFPARFDNDFNNFDLKGFGIFNDLKDVDLVYAIDVSADNNAHVAFIQATYLSPVARRGYIEATGYQSWAISKLKRDFGHILIKPETVLEKIMDLFEHQDIDFEEDEEFSRKFYVLAQDRDKTLSALNANFRSAILNIETDDFVIEILNNHLIIGSKKFVDPNEAVHFAEFANKVSSLH
jgi:hypothetical protein